VKSLTLNKKKSKNMFISDGTENVKSFKIDNYHIGLIRDGLILLRTKSYI
jgi:hypothetical protein